MNPKNLRRGILHAASAWGLDPRASHNGWVDISSSDARPLSLVAIENADFYASRRGSAPFEARGLTVAVQRHISDT